MGENATLEIRPFSPGGSSRDKSPRGGVPQSHTPAVGGGDQLAIGRKACHEGDSRQTFQRPNGRAGILQIPDPGRLVGARRDQPLAIDRKTDGCDRPLMALERQERRALRVQLLRVRPDLDRPFGIGRGQLRAVAGEGHRRDGRRVSGPCCAIKRPVAVSRTSKVPDSLAPTASRRPSGVERGGIQRSTGAKVLRQGSHRLRGRIEAEDGGQLAGVTVAHDGQRQTIGRQGETFDRDRISDRETRSLRRSRRHTTESCRRR